jgi:hypothetical protein
LENSKFIYLKAFANVSALALTGTATPKREFNLD